MHSQEDASHPRRAPGRRAVLVLLALAWLVGLTLALQHRLGHAAGHGQGTHEPHDTHWLGGEHHDDDGTCRLVDQAGLGEALPNAATVQTALEARGAPAPGHPAPRPGAAPWWPYEARAPPRG